MTTRNRTRVSGPMAVEGEPTGDGRMLEKGALVWEGVLPFPIVFDAQEGDHTAAVVGAIEEVTRKPNGVVWGDGYVEDSDVPEFQALVDRARELLEQGAVGVSLRMDSETVEVRVEQELMQISEEEPVLQENGDRVVVATYSADDVLYVTTSARCRHLAIVDTAALIVEDGRRFGIAASGHISLPEPMSASAAAGDWRGYEHFFDNPNFGDPSQDPRLRYDPERAVWSCPNTVLDDGRVFGHITPMGICLRGRPDKCISPPDGDLEGFMRGRAPAAGGLRTGVICVDGGHCKTGIGPLEATQFYDNTGHAVCDVRVGRDSYGIWYAGMLRPGAKPENVYAFEASDVSGHWEYPLMGARNRATLVGLPAVNVGGLPKGYLTYREFSNGLAASAGITAEEGCSAWNAFVDADGEVLTGQEDVQRAILQQLNDLSMAVGELYAAYLRTQE